MDVPVSYLINVTDDRLVVRYFMVQEQASSQRSEVDFTVNIPHMVYAEEEAARLWHHQGAAGEIEIVDQDRMIIGEHVAPEWEGLMLTELGAVVFDESYLGFPEETLFLVPVYFPDGVMAVGTPVNLHDRYDFLMRPTALFDTSAALAAALERDGLSNFFKVRIGPIGTYFDCAYFMMQASSRFSVVGTPIDAPGQFSNTLGLPDPNVT